ncbi:MAG: 16S rRNA (cytidine(1402)-2'-O)-methyltransferase [Alphaproteobacteria bacterium]|nr:16S rRNA (cytidine(1402)-2'-O)-methyltransferase [Alphaproteobacteria bacterium]
MLYLVATPIGNLGDFSERAKQTLQSVDLVACEDTRTSLSLFKLLGIKVKATTAYHDHNATTVYPKLIKKLQAGQNIALVSDAGTPLISDPGYKLVHACREQNIPVTTIPGANAVLSALQLSGLPSNRFFFQGFLPPKSGARQKVLQELASIHATLIVYETSNRLIQTLTEILHIMGNRQVAVVREITKKFEETKIATIQNLIQFYRAQGEPKGELVLVIEAAQNAHPAQELDWPALIQSVRPKYAPKQAAQILSEQTGLKKNEVYQKILEYEKKN